MVTLNYGSTSIPSDNYTVRAGGTVQVAAAFERTVGLVGGMDTDDGTASEGEVEQVNDGDDARDLFGPDSELATQVEHAYLNGATEVYAVGVPETDETESVTDSATGTLDNAPIFNPELHEDHTLTVTDSVESADVEVTIVYDEPSQPDDDNEMEINPITGEWAADEQADYDIEYTYGEYADAVVDIADEAPRIIGLCTESESVVNDQLEEVNSADDDFTFMHVHAGATPFADTDNPDTANYEQPYDEYRLSAAASPYGYVDDAETEMVRTVGAIAGELSGLPLGVSSTNNSLSGLTGLRTDLSPSQAGDLIDAGVMPLIDYPPVTIVKDMTTSEDSKFERVYSNQVVDEVVTLLHEINRNYIGKQARDGNIRNLNASVTNMLRGLTTSDPPLLDNLGDEKPYAVDVERSESDDNVFEMRVGLDPIGVIDTITTTVTVGDVVTAERS